MKHFLFFICLLVLPAFSYGQADTLYTKKQKKIVCKITEINEQDIKYTLAEMTDGPVYVISRTAIFKYTLSNGYTELIVPDELSLENEHGEIIKNRQAIKIHPFSIVNNQVSLAYEKVIKVGMNLDVELGYINNSINKNPIIVSNGFRNNYYYYNNYYTRRILYSGGYIKPGIKFFLGQDYSVKGLKYAHPLKGRYIRLELALSFLNYKNLERYEYSKGIITKTIASSANTLAYGAFVSYGRQFILGNVLTLEYFLSVGFTGQSNSYSNPEYEIKNRNSADYYNYNSLRRVSNYGGFQRIPDLGLSGTLGLRLGYILPDKKSRKAK